MEREAEIGMEREAEIGMEREAEIRREREAEIWRRGQFQKKHEQSAKDSLAKSDDLLNGAQQLQLWESEEFGND